MTRFNRQFDIDGRSVGEGCPVYVIAEAGVAHFGSEDKALRLVDLAADAGADAVKFQVFDVEELISRELPDWKRRLGSRQLPYDSFRRIQAHCRDRGITFFATAHDEPSLDFLHGIEVPVFKIGSGEVGNWPYLRRIAGLGKPVILSTGMYSLDQIGEALSVMAEAGARDLALLHCVTLYPTPPENAVLGSIRMMQDRFDPVIGYSDHTRGYHIPLAAVALGARVIEKHISLDFDVPDAQDWKVSCGPEDLGLFISQLREIEAALGDRSDAPAGAELESLAWASKSLVLMHDVPAGTVLGPGDLRSKRPGSGIPPSRQDEVIGRPVTVDLTQDTVIKWEHLA